MKTKSTPQGLPMPPHQARVIDEKRELDEKREKLGAFKNTSIFSGLPWQEQERLNTQAHIMTMYSAVLGERIAAFSTKTIALAATNITLQPGERYAGILLGKDDERSHHLILLPGEVKGVTHAAATEWAASIGGELPSRCEQALLFANMKEDFATEAYWSAELYESGSGYAWYQGFFSGGQGFLSSRAELRARAVRRILV